jgi:hypothetical protein
LLGLSLGLVVSVDPYDKLGVNPWGFRTKAVAQSRENKFMMLEQAKVPYEAFLLGSSAAHRFPMQTLRELSGLHSFNYSAQHTNPEDYLAILRHILDKQRPRLLLLQVDFSELNRNYQTSNQLFSSPLQKYLRKRPAPASYLADSYLTLEALGDALRVIYVNNWGKALHNNYVEHGDYIHEPLVDKPVVVSQAGYEGWELSEERLSQLREIKDMCEANNIRLIVFTAPLAYEHYRIAAAHPGHQLFLRSLVEIFGSVWNFQHESIRDFSTYREFQDSNHMTRDFSATLLTRMLGGRPEGLGELLTQPQVSQH